jgi:hypothetical protein
MRTTSYLNLILHRPSCASVVLAAKRVKTPGEPIQRPSVVKEKPGTDAVLVSVDSISTLSKAYPPIRRSGLPRADEAIALDRPTFAACRRLASASVTAPGHPRRGT